MVDWIAAKDGWRLVEHYRHGSPYDWHLEVTAVIGWMLQGGEHGSVASVVPVTLWDDGGCDGSRRYLVNPDGRVLSLDGVQLGRCFDDVRSQFRKDMVAAREAWDRAEGEDDEA